MSDIDDLYVSFDDDEPEADDIQGDEGQNRTFLIGAIILAAVFVLGICAVVIYLIFGRGQQGGVSQNEIINQTNEALFAASQTASFQTMVAVPTETPEVTEAVTVAVEATETPTSMMALTPMDGTPGEVAGTPGEGTGTPVDLTPGAETPTPLGTEVAEVTGAPTAGAGTPTALVPASPSPLPTSSIIEVTALPGGPTPTRIVSGEATATPVLGIGGAFTPTPLPGTLPTTGFVTNGAGVIGIGVLAVVLVAVVVVARRLRLR